MSVTITLINPAVRPYSSPEAIREWIAELKELDRDSPEVQDALARARRWLELAEANSERPANTDTGA